MPDFLLNSHSFLSDCFNWPKRLRIKKSASAFAEGVFYITLFGIKPGLLALCLHLRFGDRRFLGIAEGGCRPFMPWRMASALSSSTLLMASPKCRLMNSASFGKLAFGVF